MGKAIPRSEFFRQRLSIAPNGCWLWTGHVHSRSGYGTLRVDKRIIRAHRYSYEAQVGPIPEGLNLDHLCHTRDQDCAGGPTCLHRRCVNPDHLEPVTIAVNVNRGAKGKDRLTHCPQGHAYEGSNLYVDKTGRRHCRACRNATVRRRYHADPRPKRGHASSRKTHCPQGHPYQGDNLYISPVGGRMCRECGRIRSREAGRRKSAKKRAARDATT